MTRLHVKPASYEQTCFSTAVLDLKRELHGQGSHIVGSQTVGYKDYMDIVKTNACEAPAHTKCVKTYVVCSFSLA